MTTIDSMTLSGLRVHSITDYVCDIEGWVDTIEEYNELEHLFSKVLGTSVQVIQGQPPIAADPTEDDLNIRYCTFTSQEIMHLRDGYYLFMSFTRGASARIPKFIFRATMAYLGGKGYLQPAFRGHTLERDLDNDWGI